MQWQIRIKSDHLKLEVMQLFFLKEKLTDRLQAGVHLYGKQLFTWQSLVVSFMASFVLSFFPLDVLDGIWDLIESVSEGFLTYSYNVQSVIEISSTFKAITLCLK